MPSVYEQALRWAEHTFGLLDGQSHDGLSLIGECKRLLAEFPGLDRKKWLFIYCPTSPQPLFEAGPEFPRTMVACTRLQTVASEGGMILGADCSRHWGTPRCNPQSIPLVVCKPQSPMPAPPKPARRSRQMPIGQLAARLKKRLRRKGLATKKVLALMDNEDMIWSYLKCPRCGGRFVSNLLPVLAAVSSEEDFAALSNLLLCLHSAETHGQTVALAGHPDRPVSVQELRAMIRNDWKVEA